MRQVPGRSCPVQYRYDPTIFATPAAMACEVLYVVGGLYGNSLALDAVCAAFAAESGSKQLLFNGDFNWLTLQPEAFQHLNERVLRYAATRGNIETELGTAASGLGCGCAYPDWVEEAVVTRSNAIMRRLQQMAAAFPALRAQFTALPMWQRIDVGTTRVAIVHGDAESLAGWGFAQESLKEAGQLERVRRWFTQAAVDVFASTHTGLPVFQRLETSGGSRVIANNGAAGLPNFAGTQYGVLTRIATRPYTGAQRCFGLHAAGVFIDALAVPYDAQAWARCFLAQWPPGSDAYAGYWRRMQHGPAYTPLEALR
ncbi:MAG: metallophosphoesterase [Candidatus Tectimicrobiota bacterium]